MTKKPETLEKVVFRICNQYALFAYGNPNEYRRNVAKALIKYVEENYERKTAYLNSGEVLIGHDKNEWR